MNNLVSNAVKFSEDGGVEIVSSYTDSGGELTIAVRDTGIGMSRAQCEMLFQAFTQADSSTTRRFGGTGLGLSICALLTQSMGGRIDVESKPDRGTEFRVHLPVAVLAPAGVREDGHTGNRRGSAATALAGQRVLLVDDGRDNQRLIGLYLKRAGATVSAAADGLAAVEAVAEAEQSGKSFDLILMDMLMPVMDGYTATQSLRGQGCAIPIVALTANAMSGDRNKCLEAGCDDYLSKPVAPRDLVRTCQRWIGSPAGTAGTPPSITPS